MRYSQFGVIVHDKCRATPGFTLFSPNFGHEAYLIGMRGEVLHKWNLPCQPGNYSYLLKNGNLLWAGKVAEGNLPTTGGKGGWLREYDWDGNVIWEYRDANQHHDFRRLENGNTIYLGWEAMLPENAARVRGGRPGTEKSGVIYGDYVREIDPAGNTVWEWHAQDLEIEDYPLNPVGHREEFAHANACCPLANGDVMISFRKISTIIIIDRKTKKPRWEKRDDRWGQQHDCGMLPNGNILFFANGQDTGMLPHSRVIELDPNAGETVWSYQGNPPWTFFSPHISGAQRLASGNTLICEGQWGRIFEVTPSGEIVWEYISPYHGEQHPGVFANWVFRSYRYAADSPEIRGRLGRVEV